MLRRYELTDDEWNRIADLVPPENTGKQGHPRKSNRVILNGIIWIARSGAPWCDLPERYGPWETVYSHFRKWTEDGILDIRYAYGNVAMTKHKTYQINKLWKEPLKRLRNNSFILSF